MFTVMTCMNYCPLMLVCKGKMSVRELKWVLGSGRVSDFSLQALELSFLQISQHAVILEDYSVAVFA